MKDGRWRTDSFTGYRISFWGNENVLKLGRGDDYTATESHT